MQHSVAELRAIENSSQGEVLVQNSDPRSEISFFLETAKEIDKIFATRLRFCLFDYLGLWCSWVSNGL